MSFGTNMLQNPTTLGFFEPTPQSSLVSFFHNYPRFSGGNDLSQDRAYIAGVATVTVPWFALAVITLVIGLCSNLFGGRVRRRKLRERIDASNREAEVHSSDHNGSSRGLRSDVGSEPSSHASLSYPRAEPESFDNRAGNRTAVAFPVDRAGTNQAALALGEKGEVRSLSDVSGQSASSNDSSVLGTSLRQTVLGVVIFSLALILVGTAFISNTAFRESSLDVIKTVEFGVSDVAGAGLVIANFLTGIIDAANDPNSNIGALGDVLDGLGDISTAADAFSAAFDDFFDRFSAILNIVRSASRAIFAVFIVFLLLLLGGLFTIFLLQSNRKHSARCARFVFLFPLALSWVVVGVVLLSGVLLGDTCVSLGDFQRLLLVEAERADADLVAGIDPADNVLIANNVRCPRNIPGLDPSIFDTLSPALTGTGGLATTVENAVGIVLDAPNPGEIVDFVSVSFAGLESCDTVLMFAARLAFFTCSSSGPPLALFVLFWSLLGLAVVLTVSFFLAQYSALDTGRFIRPRYFRQREVEPVVQAKVEVLDG